MIRDGIFFVNFGSKKFDRNGTYWYTHSMFVRNIEVILRFSKGAAAFHIKNSIFHKFKHFSFNILKQL